MAKQCKMLKLIYDFYRLGIDAINRGVEFGELLALPSGKR